MTLLNIFLLLFFFPYYKNSINFYIKFQNGYLSNKTKVLNYIFQSPIALSADFS
jgi:hypothetical protein